MFVGRDIKFLGFLFFVALFCHQNRGVCSYVDELDDDDVTCVGRHVPGTENEERVGEHETSRQKGVNTRLEDDGQVAVSRWTVWDLPPLFPYFILGEDQFFSRPGSRVALVRFLGGMIVSDPRPLNGRIDVWEGYENLSIRSYIERDGFRMLEGYGVIDPMSSMVTSIASISEIWASTTVRTTKITLRDP